MFVSALRVKSADKKREGINAYYYESSMVDWSTDDAGKLMQQALGSLKKSFYEVQPGPDGNEVRTYLDIAAPDEMPLEELMSAFTEFWTKHQLSPVPWLGKSGRAAFEYNSEIQLSPVGAIESRKLFERCKTAIVAARPD
jgi:hypothetical protein